MDLKNESLKKSSILSKNASDQEWTHHAVVNDHRFEFLYDE